ncbi:MAG: hypothetical protein AEth_01479 [Candidatus Argoarchaeum ethanivorans]|uniref:DUF4325 domain-containing protein n=1 Tax=Candidatus Argoarchaeum ethanivorans TaxID=2608793 RepID=A0A8B3S0E1_9EURY|nr:MAG: hypothetical protein AEth_01479 [Candidatus Argoarchaeum ethanivorans]
MYQSAKERPPIKDIIGPHLALRYSADKLFDDIDSLKNTDIIIDFQDVYTTSRSFMHRFLYRLQKSDNHIICINETENIVKMRDIVKMPKEKTVVVNPTPKRVINLASNMMKKTTLAYREGRFLP